MADTFSDIAKNASSMSVAELGSSLLGRKEATQKAQNKRDRKDARIAQVLGVLTAGQGLFKNAFKRRQKELANVKTLDLLNNEADAKEISNISSIINVIPKDFTKAINPATGLPYTVAKNTDRFFENQATAEAFTDKLSPIIDQQIKFSADANMAIDNPSKYQVVKERAAREIFQDMITGNKHITFLEGLEELYIDKGYTRDELLQQGLGITAGSLNSLKTSRYAKMERELQDRPGLFNPKTYLNIFKGIGKDKAEQGELNIFQSLTEKDLSAPKMTEVLETMNLKGIIIPAFDKAMAQARLSPDRYLAKVRSPKFENQRTNMSEVVLLNLNDEIEKGKSFKKYGLQKYINDGTMDDMTSHISNTEAVKRTFETRAVGLSERLKYDKAFAITLYKEANPSARPDQLADFAEDIKTTEFRNKFSALAVLKAGIVDVGFSITEEWAPSANTEDNVPLAMRDISKVSQTQFDKQFQEEYGISIANMADKIDPLISPMFKPTGEVTPEYHALPSKAGKTIAYDMQVNMVMNSQLNEQEKGERLEKFFNITPNPRGAPDVESYIVAMQSDTTQVGRTAKDFGVVAQTDMNLLRKLRKERGQIGNPEFLNPMQINREIDTLEKTLTNLESNQAPALGLIGADPTKTIPSDLSVNEKATAIAETKELLSLYKQQQAYQSTDQQGLRTNQEITTSINQLKSELVNTDDLKPSQIIAKERAIKKLEEELNYLNKPEETSEEETGTEPVTLDITKPRAVGKDITFKAIDTVVDVQGVSDEYKKTSKTFLQYLAKAESKYGEDKNTFNNPLSNATGIFQIIPSKAFFEVQRVINKTDFEPNEETGADVRAYNELLKNQLGIDLATATEADLETPLYSAAFARAYLMRYQPAIPTDPLKMAEYYADAYVKDPDKTQRDKYIKRFLIANGFLVEGGKQTLKSLLGR